MKYLKEEKRWYRVDGFNNNYPCSFSMTAASACESVTYRTHICTCLSGQTTLSNNSQGTLRILN